MNKGDKMEAKDTVKNAFTPAYEQAEISFRAGIKEVVEWVNNNINTDEEVAFKGIGSWQAKLKEWGIK
jgi:nucleoid DNA-binding protein